MPKKKIAIVGGGIAGLYCAWKLVKDHDVTLFEVRKELGGRIETIDGLDEDCKPCVGFEGFKAECGPMRFRLELEDCFRELTHELGITKEKHFAEFPVSNPNPEFPKYHLRDNEMSRNEIDDPHAASALELLKYGIYRLFHQKEWEHRLTLPQVINAMGGNLPLIQQLADRYADSGTDLQRRQKNCKTYDYIRTEHSIREDVSGAVGERFLYTFGFWNALSTVLSPGAVAKIRDTGTFYHLMPENPSAAEWSIFWLRSFKSADNSKLWTIRDGVNIVVKRLREELGAFQNNNRYFPCPEKKVTAIRPEGADKLRLTAGGKESDEFDHIILALPAEPLKRVVTSLPKLSTEIRNFVNGVIPFTLLKVFAVIKRPRDWGVLPQPQSRAYLVPPAREVHYLEPTNRSRHDQPRIMIMLYTDRPGTEYWRPYVLSDHTKAQVGEPPELKRDIARQIAALIPKEGRDDGAHIKRVEDDIIAYAIRDWSQPPFEAACHAWKPGIDVPAALKRLKAFRLDSTSGRKNIHVCGEAYSDYQGFIEGALRSVVGVVDAINTD